ncbi:condensin subunit Smc [Pedobacter psychrotolerans]|uniref:Chromosome partition protein Smc n=1 Tax=Pedobacter psychrotolerans TaxID=1843235 RepID=A0A4R2H6Q6_9SPHI|nr:chromosome segregation protein SMC [Pedobacter psychrotolerans]TCO20748.1 condensin subunit Smc [Pedobacter psychrotolerans]GGE67792.1 chromosome partition protein Smc [Pedobacter psychrotolerans]
MQLTRLEIKGFKSFGDKVTINFNEGVTAIVGPNGCGKSNVIDAMRWVLGEQSTKALRSEKMENIIFNGTKNRKQAQLAEVSLSFDNTKNILPTAYSQVTVTRKLYRNGDSEYRLNDVQCRLKDITDLFLDTGIGSDSYSIIELKMVDEIITNKEHSRRSLFEEASGISKYKLRKKQTFNKLKDTETDLERVEDLLFEIEKNLKTLESQAKKAERYYKLKEQYRELSIQLATHRIAFFRTDLDALESQEQNQQVSRSELSTKIDQQEAELQKLKLGSINQEKNLSIQQKATNELISKIRAYESEKKVKNEQMRFLQEKETRLAGELEKDKNQLNHIKYNIKRLNEEVLIETEVFNRLEADLKSLKLTLDTLREQQQTEKNRTDRLIKSLGELQNQVYQSQKEIDILNIQKDALVQETNRNEGDAETKTLELKAFDHALAELDIQISEKQRNIKQFKEAEEILKEKLAASEITLASNKEKLTAENRKKDAKQNEYNLTKSLVDSLEGYPESIRFLKKNNSFSKNALLLSDILFCDEDYRIAIENYLEPVMNHYVVDEYIDAVQAINLLTDSSRGRANFFVLENVPDKNPVFTPHEGLVPALSVIDVDKKYQKLCNLLLQNVYLAVSEQEQIFRESSAESLTILAKNGKYAQSRFTLSGGSVGLFEGKRIGRVKNLENLAKEIKASESLINRYTEVINAETNQIFNLKEASKLNEINTLQQELNRFSNEQISVQTRRDQYQEFITTSENRKTDIAQKIASIEKSLEEKLPALVELQQKQQQEHLNLQEQQLNYQELADQVNESASKYNQDNIRFHQQQNKLAGLEKDLDYRFVQEEALDKRIAQNDQELQETLAQITATLQHTDLSDDTLLEMYQQREDMEKGLADVEKEYFESKGTINNLEGNITVIRKNREETDFLLTEIKDKKNTLKIDLNSLKERLAVEFNIDINDLLETETAVETLESEFEIRQKVEKMKRQLDEFGAINSMAMEAFKEMEERYVFIQDQKRDLNTAKTDLLQTIKEIDDTAKEKFMQAFTKAREHFIVVFRSLFNEEDSCDLILSDINNPLEADIDIIARPKGKRPLSINQLSGGEKTLTATALLFSLYLLKPAPFCIFDEVDAPLDDTNIDKFNNIIRKFSDQSQFIIVSHNKRTIASTDIIYGVTMVEQGVSRVVAVDLREVAA